MVAIVWEQSGVYRRFWGTLSGADYKRAQDQVFGDARFDSLRYAIVDFTEVVAFLTSRGEAEEIAASNHGAYQSNPHLRVAFVTTDGPMAALLDSMSAVSAYPLRVFPSLELARAWIGEFGS